MSSTSDAEMVAVQWILKLYHPTMISSGVVCYKCETWMMQVVLLVTYFLKQELISIKLKIPVHIQFQRLWLLHRCLRLRIRVHL